MKQRTHIGILALTAACFFQKPDEVAGATSSKVTVETPAPPKPDEPEKKVTETKETEQAVSNEPGAPVIKTTETKEHTE